MFRGNYVGNAVARWKIRTPSRDNRLEITIFSTTRADRQMSEKKRNIPTLISALALGKYRSGYGA